MRYIVACLAMVLIVALPLVTMSLVEVSRPVAEAGPILNPPLVMRTTPVEVVELPLEPFDAAVPETPERVAHMPWMQRIATALEPALPWLVLGWLLGVFGLSTWHLGGWAQLQRMKRRLVSEVAAPLHARAAELAGRLGIRRAIGLWASPLIDVPAVVGWIKPVILLPVGAVSGLSVEQLEAILAHELAHVRRCDYLVNLAQTVVEILGFYHPAVWWVSHRIRDERENCCDDLAVQVCGDSRRYARALTSLEELRHVARASRPRVREEEARARCPRHTAVAASGGSLVGRIARLLGRPPVDHRRFAWLPGLIALLVVAAILIPTALVLATPDAPPTADTIASEPVSDAAPLEVTTQTLHVDQEQDQPKVLVNLLLFTYPMPNKIVDRETKRRIGDVLAPEIPSARQEIASMQNCTLVQILQTWVVGRTLTRHTMEVLVDVLQSRGYLEGEATPEILLTDNVPGHMNLITEELTLPAQDPTSPPKPIALGTFVQLTPHVPPATSDRVTLEIGVEWKSRIEQSDPNNNPTFRSTEIASTVTVLRDHYFTLLAEPDDKGNAETGIGEFHLVMLCADLFEPDLSYATTAAAPTPAGKSLSRQVILDIQTVSVEKGSLGDGIVEWSRPQTSGPQTSGWLSGILMGYTPDRTFTDALRTRLDELYAHGVARRLAHQRLTTQEGYEARFMAVKEEWFSLAPAPPGNAADPGPEHASIASGTIITAIPTIGDANSITLNLNIEFSESLPKGEGLDLPIVTRRTSRNVVTVRDGGTALLAGLSSMISDGVEDVTILVTAHLAPEIEPVIQPDHPLPQAARPSEAPAIHTPVPSPPRVATVEPSADAADRQVLLSFTIAEIVTEEALDRATARQLRALLTDASRDAKFNLPSVEELQKPVQYIVSKYANICNQIDDAARAFTDLLVSRGYATVCSSPEMLIRLGASGHLSCDNIPAMGPPAPPSQTDNSALSLDVTPTAPHDANGIRLTLALRARNLVSLDSEGRFSAKAAYASFDLVLSARNNQCVMLPLTTAVALDAKTTTTLLLVKPTLIEPPAAPALAPSASEQATADAARDFVQTDPMVRELAKRIAEIETELLEAQQTFLPEHPEIVQKKQLLEALRRRLEERRRELHQELDDDLATRLPSVRVSTRTPDERASSRDDKPKVMLDIELVKFLTNQPLSPEAAAQLSSLWDQMYARRETGREQRGSLPRVEGLQISPQALLERCTENAQGDSEALEILVDLLASREYLKVAMNPTVEVFDGRQAQVMSKQHVPNPTTQPGAPETVECRDLVTVTPRIDSAGHINLDLAAEICDVILNDGKTPRIRKHSIDTKAVVDENNTFVCRLESAAEGETQDNGVLYLLARPRIVPSAPAREPATVTATFVDTDLIEALAEISEQTQAKIAVDPTVKHERITARLSETSIDTALQTVLQDTASTFKKLGDTDTYTVFRPLSGTFQGTDLREALRQVAEQAGVNVTWDATVGGEAWAEFEDVSLQTALRMLLAGSPYVTTRTPDGYAITKRNAQPPAAPSREADAIEVAARFVLVDRECMEAMQRGLPIKGVAAPADVNALHEIGNDLAEGRTPLLEPDRVGLLLKAVQQYAGSKMLAAPKVTVLDGESASVSLANHIQYTSGYREPNDASPEPIAQHASKEVGVRLDATPHLIEDQNNIRLQFEMEINSLLRMQKALYRGKYEYDVPTFTAVTTATEIVIPDGQTALIHVGETPAVGNILSDESEPAGPLLMLITPSRTKAEPLDPAPPMQRERRPGDPGMGGLPPGTNLR